MTSFDEWRLSRNDRYFDAGDREDKTRTPGQRDRDRILASSGLKRLGGITQVVSALHGPTFHNRLTHTLKVAGLGRRIARRLLGPKNEHHPLADKLRRPGPRRR